MPSFANNVKMGIGKQPYDAGKNSPVNRWISDGARAMLERDEVVQDGASSTLPLGGGQTAFGFYSSLITLGSPPQDLTVLMDTGSSDLAVNLANCSYVYSDGAQEACPNQEVFSLATDTRGSCATSQTFDPSTSTTASSVPCQTIGLQCKNVDPTSGECPSNHVPCYIQDCYGDSTGFNARVYKDNLGMDSVDTDDVMFGAIEQAFLNFTNDNYAGIFGLSFIGSTSFHETPVITTVLSDNGFPNMFSMCLGDSSTASAPTDSGAGFMILGDSGASKELGFQGFTPIISDELYYNVNLMTIGFSGVSGLGSDAATIIPVNSTFDPASGSIGTMIDSGTTEMILSYLVYEQFWETILLADVLLDTSCLTTPGSCCVMASDADDLDVVFTFESTVAGSDPVTVKRPFSEMVIDCPGGGVIPLIGGSAGNMNILGQSFMKNMLVDFDRENMQVGFTPGWDCVNDIAPTLPLLYWILIGGGILIVLVIAIVVPVVVTSRRRSASRSGNQAPLMGDQRAATYNQ